jgi:phosphoglycerol transferase MdoB-like AlkP superfamily enzyme
MKLTNFSKLTPPHVSTFLRLVAVSIGLLFLLRVLFFAFYWNSFHDTQWTDWLVGIYFDAITVFILFLPFAVIHFFPAPIHNNRVYRGFQAFYYFVVNIVLLVCNLIDLEYFKFTGKRSTFDLWTFMNGETNMGTLLWEFLAEFWWMWLIFGFFIWALWFVYKKRITPIDTSRPFVFLKQLIIFLVAIPLVVIVGRGGIQLRPLGVIEVTKFTKPSQTALVMNTAFSMIKSYGDKGLEDHQFFDEKTANELFNPIRTSKPAELLNDKTNVVILILESFGNEWLAFNNPDLGTSYTPFLDSLAGESWVFSQSFSNGKKSIEALPSILASMPSWMNTPYISSNYNGNKINTLPEILKSKGYETAFFHGATNGSMRFDSFSSLAGIDNYFGRTEYNNEDHYDQTWGILDEYFNPWSAKKMSELKAPFFASLFTLSSHHPYFVPKNRQKEIISGPEPIAASISYGDLSLRKFFEEAKKQPWYENTLFVLCADHTPASNSAHFNYRQEMYRIPIVFYHPSGKLPKEKRKDIFQHIDIMPTVLDLLNIETKYYAFGQSIFGKKERFALTYLEGVYYYFSGRFMINFSGNEVRNIFDLGNYHELTLGEQKEKKEDWVPKAEKLKAIIQRYNHDLIMNQTMVK